MIKNGSFYLLGCLFLIVLAFTKCKDSTAGRWTCYQFFHSNLGDNLICISIDDTLKTANLHWFINVVGGFCHMEFLDTLENSSNDEIEITYNSLKTNSFKVVSMGEIMFPLDQDPEFSFNSSTKTLRFYDKILEEYELKNDDYLNELLDKQKNWDYKPFSF